jgi:hypothetical protein
MIIYSVTVNVEDVVVNDWVQWMQQQHIPDVLATGKFEGYMMHRLVNPQPEDGSHSYNIQYLCRSQALLDQYMEEDAPGLQAEHTQRFGDYCVAFRVILERVSHG